MTDSKPIREEIERVVSGKLFDEDYIYHIEIVDELLSLFSQAMEEVIGKNLQVEFGGDEHSGPDLDLEADAINHYLVIQRANLKELLK